MSCKLKLCSYYFQIIYNLCMFVGFRSRKRRPSSSQDQDESREEEMKDDDGDDEPKEEEMTECTAALVLMSLSCSPHSPSIQGRYTNFVYFHRIPHVYTYVNSFANFRNLLRRKKYFIVFGLDYILYLLSLESIRCNFAHSRT